VTRAAESDAKGALTAVLTDLFEAVSRILDRVDAFVRT
jgi:hypothetical protein